MKNESQIEHYKKMTETPVHKLILKLCIPTILSMLVSNIYNLVDTAFVGKLGNSASGAVGIVFGFMTIIQAVGFMFGNGSGSILARRLGNKDIAGASTTASTGFFLSLTLGAVASILCFIFIRPLVMFLGSTETIAPYAITYISFILITAPIMTAGFTLNNILRYEGKAFYAMIGMFGGCILNIIGDYIFMFVFHMGIAGAGLSTAIGQLVSFQFLLTPFLRGKTQSKLSIRKLDLSLGHLYDIVATGFPSLLRQGLNSVATILLNSLSGGYGDAAVAAMSIVSRVFFFIFAIALGVGQALQPICSFNYGAKKFSRVRKAYRFTSIMATAIIIIPSIFVLIMAPQTIYLFREDMDVVGFGTRALRLQCIAGVVMPFCMTTELLLQSTGKKLPASILSALRSGVIFIPALLIFHHFRGMAGIQEAQPFAYAMSIFPTLFFSTQYFQKLPKSDGKPDKA